MAGCLLPLIMLLLVALWAGSAYGQSIKEGKAIAEWTPVYTGKTEDGQTSKISWASIRRNEDIIKVWVKVDFPNGADIVGASDGKMIRGIISVREFVIIDCAKRESGGDTEIIYLMNGRIQARDNFYAKNSAKEPTQDNFGRFIANYFCERGPIPTETPTLKLPNKRGL